MQVLRLVLLALAFCAWPREAHAYAWMIRHGYSQCTQCHVDPSGGGPMTEYGRAMSEVILRTRYKGERADDEGKAGNLLFGFVNLPEGLDFGGDILVSSLHTKVERLPSQSQIIWMQLDANSTVQIDRFVASGTIGYAPKGALGATLTRGPDSNLISREHWLGYWLNDSHQLLLRAGRMNVPFGIRSIEHTLWARAYTRSDINDSQQYGLSGTFIGDNYRAEVQAIAGDLQIRPDVFRERGYSACGEYLPIPRLAIGASSRIDHVKLDTRLLKEEWRHAHGVFSRWATPWEPLVLLTEWDYVLESPRYALRRKGVVGYLQADIEASQGVHFIATGEANNVGVGSNPASWGAWLSYQWFFAPHADIRLDNVYQSVGGVSGSTGALSFLLQAHVFL